MKHLLVALILLSFSSCCPFLPKSAARLYASQRVAPYEKAADNFYKKHGDFPKDINQLCKADKNIDTLVRNKDEHTQWAVNYRYISAGHYQLYMNHSHYNVSYHNGKHASTYVNCWR
ncbi:hypothetical protein Rhal01_02129 [Rubritalea halochordaticola]|uniref:Lipoprotein n=1 Tax=Rubritalea halochordaticola TaxID=714537 RepID=A0ABP9UZT2_9BACT